MNVKPGRARNHLVPYKFATYPSEFRLAEAATKRETWTEATMATVGDDAAAKVSPDVDGCRKSSDPIPRLFRVPVSGTRPPDQIRRVDERLLLRTRVSEGINRCLQNGVPLAV